MAANSDTVAAMSSTRAPLAWISLSVLILWFAPTGARAEITSVQASRSAYAGCQYQFVTYPYSFYGSDFESSQATSGAFGRTYDVRDVMYVDHCVASTTVSSNITPGHFLMQANGSASAPNTWGSQVSFHGTNSVSFSYEFEVSENATARIRVGGPELHQRLYAGLYSSAAALAVAENAALDTTVDLPPGRYTFSGGSDQDTYNYYREGPDTLQSSFSAAFELQVTETPACTAETCACGVAVSVPISGGVGASFERALSCPVFGKTAKVQASVEGSVEGEVTSCPDCKASLTRSGSIEGEVDICRGQGFSLEGSASYSYEKELCTECDEATCELSCDLTRSCENESIEGTARVGVSNFYGFTPPTPKRLSARATAYCGLTLNGSAAATVARQETTGENACVTCTQCEKNSFESTSGVSGKGGCAVVFSAGKSSTTVGCTECATGSVELSAGGSLQSGACGEDGCVFGKISASAALNLETRCVSLSWFSAPVKCVADLSGEKEFNSCAPQEATASASFGCSVVSGSEERMKCAQQRAR